MGNMPAALAIDLGKLQCDDISIPVMEPGKVLVKTEMASICGSDLHVVYMGWNAYDFPLPHGYPGHEGIGYVVESSVEDFVKGDLVLTVPNIYESKTFAGYQLIDPKFLLKMPDGVPIPHLLMAQQLGTVVFGARKLPEVLGKTVVVVGQGSVGLFHDFMLRRLGAQRIIVIEPVANRRQAGKNMGADDIVDVVGQRAVDAVMDLTDGNGADLVVEGVGSVDTLNQAIAMTKALGTVALFGLPPTMDKVPFDWDTFFRKRLNVYATFGAQDVDGLPDFRLAVDYIRRGDIDMSPFVTHQFPITDVQEAFDLAYSKDDGALKVSLTF